MSDDDIGLTDLNNTVRCIAASRLWLWSVVEKLIQATNKNKPSAMYNLKLDDFNGRCHLCRAMFARVSSSMSDVMLFNNCTVIK